MEVIQSEQIQVVWGPEAYTIVGAHFNNAQLEIQNWVEACQGPMHVRGSEA